MGVTWIETVTNSDILRRTSLVSLESIISRRQLRWLGHVIRMEDSRVPKQLLYGGMRESEWSVGGQKKRHKDHVKTIHRKRDMEPASPEALASNRVE